jgi:hypothetical protein
MVEKVDFNINAEYFIALGTLMKEKNLTSVQDGVEYQKDIAQMLLLKAPKEIQTEVYLNVKNNAERMMRDCKLNLQK